MPSRPEQQTAQKYHPHLRGHQHVQLRAQFAQSAELEQDTLANKPKTYNPRHPERNLLYKTVAQHFEIRLELSSARQFDGQGD